MNHRDEHAVYDTVDLVAVKITVQFEFAKNKFAHNRCHCGALMGTGTAVDEVSGAPVEALEALASSQPLRWTETQFLSK